MAKFIEYQTPRQIVTVWTVLFSSVSAVVAVLCAAERIPIWAFVALMIVSLGSVTALAVLSEHRRRTVTEVVAGKPSSPRKGWKEATVASIEFNRSKGEIAGLIFGMAVLLVLAAASVAVVVKRGIAFDPGSGLATIAMWGAALGAVVILAFGQTNLRIDPHEVLAYRPLLGRGSCRIFRFDEIESVEDRPMRGGKQVVIRLNDGTSFLHNTGEKRAGVLVETLRQRVAASKPGGVRTEF